MVNRYVLLTSAALASPVAAQVSNTVGTVAVPPSQPAPTPTPTPAAPAPTPTPSAAPVAPPPVVATATPTPTPSPTASPRRRAEAAVSRPAPTTTSPTPTATPDPAATAVAAPVPLPVPSATPTAAAPVEVEQGLPFWAIPAGLVALLLVGAAIYAVRRRRAEDEPVDEPVAEEVVPVAAPLPLARDAMPAPAPAPQFLEPTAPLAPRAMLEVDVIPRRAGVNLLTATADVEVTVTNTGDAPATAVRIGAQLTSAQAGQDDALGQLFAAPVTKPAAAPFDLAPGESRTVRTLLTLARDAIVVLTAADRPMFIPVAAINITYARGDGQAGQTAAAFAIGVERDGVAKLAPFWLDGPSRMHDRLGVRPHALALRS